MAWWTAPELLTITIPRLLRFLDPLELPMYHFLEDVDIVSPTA